MENYIALFVASIENLKNLKSHTFNSKSNSSFFYLQ